MIVKSSFSIRSGKGTASISYITREGSLEGGKAPIFDRQGNVLDRQDVKELLEEIRESEMERRLIFSPSDDDMSIEDIGIMVRDVLERYQTEQDRSFEYIFAVHDHNERIHAHIVAWGDKEDLRMDKEDLASIRERALDLEQENIIELAIGKEEVLEKDNSAELDIDSEIPMEDYP